MNSGLYLIHIDMLDGAKGRDSGGRVFGSVLVGSRTLSFRRPEEIG